MTNRTRWTRPRYFDPVAEAAILLGLLALAYLLT